MLISEVRRIADINVCGSFRARDFEAPLRRILGLKIKVNTFVVHGKILFVGMKAASSSRTGRRKLQKLGTAYGDASAADSRKVS